MTPARHRAKAERIERSLARLAPSDHEIRIEAAMLASTHWLNALLHASGVSAPDQDDLRRYRLVGDGVIDALSEIEDLRPAWVRGNVAGGERAADRAFALLGTVRRAALAHPGV